MHGRTAIWLAYTLSIVVLLAAVGGIKVYELAARVADAEASYHAERRQRLDAELRTRIIQRAYTSCERYLAKETTP